MAVGLDVAVLVDVGVLDAVELGVSVGVNVGITVDVVVGVSSFVTNSCTPRIRHVLQGLHANHTVVDFTV